MASDYAYKHDLIRSYLVELVHVAAKFQSVQTTYPHMDANVRITSVFRELLDRQFPIESANQRFALRSARDYADRLGVHVNHLNRALRATTGKTTTEHIFDRPVSEAQVLLKHSPFCQLHDDRDENAGKIHRSRRTDSVGAEVSRDPNWHLRITPNWLFL
ncbi:helix-turn-helix domain-containing protein [Spirosoma arcticum]